MSPTSISPDTIEHNGNSQAIECLRKASLFSNLSHADLAVFHGNSQMRSFKKDKLIYLQEDIAHTFYIIHKGWVRLFLTLADGKDAIIEMITKSNSFGSDALFENGLHTSSAQVSEDAELLCIPLSVLKSQIATSTTLATNMLGAVFRKHASYSNDIALNSVRRAPQRLAHFIYKQCPADKEKNVAFHLPYDKTSIAQVLGMTRGSFSRALNVLREQDFIRINGALVEIESVKKLLEFSFGHRPKSSRTRRNKKE